MGRTTEANEVYEKGGFKSLFPSFPSVEMDWPALRSLRSLRLKIRAIRVYPGRRS
jgi:hypothetical protein